MSAISRQEVPEVIKFPRTAHLFDTGGTAATKDDVVVQNSQVAYQELKGRQLIVEEKMDGANVAFRCTTSAQDGSSTVLVQNRSRYISAGDHAQFSRIHEWVEEHRAALVRILTCAGKANRSLILYGEWCAARHSIPYDKLPGIFLAFDLFDPETNQFYSRVRFHSALRDSGIPVVRTIRGPNVPQAMTKTKKNQQQDDFRHFLEQAKSLVETTASAFRTDGGTLEGVVLRVDEGDWLLRRYKIVRPDFVRGCAQGHWFRRQIEKQQIDFSFAHHYMETCYVFAEAEAPAAEHKECYDVNNNDKEANAVDTTEARTQENAPCNDQVVRTKSTKKPKGRRHYTVDKDSSRSLAAAAAEKARRLRRLPRCIMLMGLPGAGKSTFAQHLCNEINEMTTTSCIIANQDRLGRKQCIQVAGQAAATGGRRSGNRHNSKRGGVVIVDRCHLTERERQEWLEIMHNPAPCELMLVYFAARAEVCTERVQQRTDHPTIGQGKGDGVRIVRQLSQRIEPPTPRERKQVFGKVKTVTSFKDANALLQELGVSTDHIVRDNR